MRSSMENNFLFNSQVLLIMMDSTKRLQIVSIVVWKIHSFNLVKFKYFIFGGFLKGIEQSTSYHLWVRWGFMAQFLTNWFKSGRPQPFVQLWLTGLYHLWDSHTVPPAPIALAFYVNLVKHSYLAKNKMIWKSYSL